MYRSKKCIGSCGMNKRARQDMGLRQVPSLGLWALDRGMTSCNMTPACLECYNRTPGMLGRKSFIACWSPGGKDDQRFESCTSEAFKGLNRVRLATRGEALRYVADVYRVAQWIRDNPKTLFWIPTRAIYIPKTSKLNLDMVSLIEDQIMAQDNARVMASIDPYTAGNTATLIKRGWSTMFFETRGVPAGYVKGKHPAVGIKGSNIVYCKKTWDLYKGADGRILHLHGVCRTCNRGCFQDKRVDVYLKNHYKAASHHDLPGGRDGRPLCK
jgi:hypothetical protein